MMVGAGYLLGLGLPLANSCAKVGGGALGVAVLSYASFRLPPSGLSFCTKQNS